MSRRRKGVTLGLREEFEVLEGQSVARVANARGGNLMEVEMPDGRVTLCIMPNKFNKKLWVRKGGFVIVEEHEDAATDTKVTGTIVQVLYEEHLKQLKKAGAWPPEFDKAAEEATMAGTGDEEDEDGDEEVVGSSGKAVADLAARALAVTSLSEGADGTGRASKPEAAAGPSGADAARAAGVGVRGAAAATGAAAGEEYEEEDDDLPPLFQNNNRKVIYHDEESDSDESDG